MLGFANEKFFRSITHLLREAVVCFCKNLKILRIILIDKLHNHSIKS